MAERPVVMVVEDDVEMNQLEREMLDVYGLDSVPAYTGNEALDVFQRHHRIDAVLLDLMLPELDGFETCRRLRLLDGELVVVILSALDSEDSRRRGYECGANAYFAKPFDPEEVIHTTQSLLRPEGKR